VSQEKNQLPLELPVLRMLADTPASAKEMERSPEFASTPEYMLALNAVNELRMEDLLRGLQGSAGPNFAADVAANLGINVSKIVVRDGSHYALLLHPDVAARAELARHKPHVRPPRDLNF
jgi:hypothetical protein